MTLKFGSVVNIVGENRLSGVGRWKMENGKWEMEVGRRKTEVRSRESGVGRWKMEVGSWKLGVVNRESNATSDDFFYIQQIGSQLLLSGMLSIIIVNLIIVVLQSSLFGLPTSDFQPQKTPDSFKSVA